MKEKKKKRRKEGRERKKDRKKDREKERKTHLNSRFLLSRAIVKQSCPGVQIDPQELEEQDKQTRELLKVPERGPLITEATLPQGGLFSPNAVGGGCGRVCRRGSPGQKKVPPGRLFLKLVDPADQKVTRAAVSSGLGGMKSTPKRFGKNLSSSGKCAIAWSCYPWAM